MDRESSALVLEAKTIDQIFEKRQNLKSSKRGRNENKIVNILIVPGHDDESYGTQFNGLKEVELNRILAQKLFDYLAKENGINPVLASTKEGYNPIFEDYFLNEKEKIQYFIYDAKESFSKKLTHEDAEHLVGNFHNTATEDVVQRLYGINRWVNDKDFDMVIHIHFNDYPGRKRDKNGKHEGFSIYTPGTLFVNHEVSKLLANSIFEELKKIQRVSSLESEGAGIIEDHELIALGANESLEAASVLVEYGYIYESKFTNVDLRETTLDYFAYATYAGIKKMINEQPFKKEEEETFVLKDTLTESNLVWQFQKALAGIYPPRGKSLNDCPITGYFGVCSGDVR